jgi:FkbM family methyltransferase
LARLVGSRGRVHAFEPQANLADYLERAFRHDARVTVHRVALSDRDGQAALGVPDYGDGLVLGHATLEPGARAHTEAVRTQRLDELELTPAFVKIDVEGHELAVLRGAVDTLRRNRPSVVVEAEERHHPNAVGAITELLAGLGYAGYFDIDGVRHAVDEFDPAEHQNPANIGDRQDDWQAHGVYVNNFVFLPVAQ